MNAKNKVAFRTLGCKLNQCETAQMQESLVSVGYALVDWDSSADVRVINTCTVTSKSDKTCRREIRLAKRRDPNCLVAVTGCYAQVNPEAVAAIPGVDLVLGNTEKLSLAEHLANMVPHEVIPGTTSAAGTATNILSRDTISAAASPHDMSLASWTSEPATITNSNPTNNEDGHTNSHDSPQIVTSSYPETPVFDKEFISHFYGYTRAFLKIQTGCDSSCAYCIIPRARGAARSMPLAQVLEQTNLLIGRGFKEIVLTGINLGSWGRDTGEGPLINLLTELIHNTDADPLANLPTELTQDLIHDSPTQNYMSDSTHSFGQDYTQLSTEISTHKSYTQFPEQFLTQNTYTQNSVLNSTHDITLQSTQISTQKSTYTAPTLTQDSLPSLRYRLSSIEPLEVSTELLDILVAAGDKVAHHFHLPLQSGSATVLSRMNRPYNPEQYLSIVNEVASRFPDAALGADVIVGFPGESEAEFEETLAFVEKSPLNYLHVFAYSDRPGTVASYQKPKVHPHIIHERSLRLRTLGEHKKMEFYQTQHNSEQIALILKEKAPDGRLVGLTGNYLEVLLPDDDTLINHFVQVKLREMGTDGRWEI